MPFPPQARVFVTNASGLDRASAGRSGTFLYLTGPGYAMVRLDDERLPWLIHPESLALMHRITFRTGKGETIACLARLVPLTVPVIEELNRMCDELASLVNGRAVFWTETEPS